MPYHHGNLREAILERLLAEDVPASAAVNNHALFPNPQLDHRQFFQTMKHPVVGDTRYPSFPGAFSAFERDLHRGPPPTLGQHNREILQGELERWHLPEGRSPKRPVIFGSSKV